MIELDKLTVFTGVKSIRAVSEHTTVVEYENGSVRPATKLETVLWSLLLTGAIPA